MTIERELLKRFMTELKTEEDVVSLFNGIKECLAQPEKKQKPTTRHALDSYWNQEAYQRGYAEAKLKLKREPLSDNEISKGYTTRLHMTQHAFYDGVKFAEKAHGIGGGE